MADQDKGGTPQSPEVQEEYVREELDQEDITHMGEWRTTSAKKGADERGKHLGALEHEMVPIVPPMAGPADLLGEEDEDAQGNETGTTKVGEERFDPRDELTPG